MVTAASFHNTQHRKKLAEYLSMYKSKLSDLILEKISKRTKTSTRVIGNETEIDEMCRTLCTTRDFIMNGDNEYLHSYADISVHRLMLEDRPRTEAYQNAILANSSAITGKIVLDVGCGTGILSIFCAQAGAKRVHAVESSDIAKLAKQVVAENKFEDIIQVHNCPVEELELNEKVDVIVSEWMGFYLLHEGMLPSVIFARDKFLAAGGIMFPESADLWVAACEFPQYFDYWSNVFGVKMESIGEFERKSRTEPVVTVVKPSSLLTEPSVLKSFNLLTVTTEDLKKISFKLVSPSLRAGNYDGICLWFVVNFPSCDDSWLHLSTAPESPQTHWQQTGVVHPDRLVVEEKQPVAYEVNLNCREEDPRKYVMEVTLLDPDKEEHPTPCDCYLTKCIVIKTYMETAVDDDDGIVEDEIEDAS